MATAVDMIHVGPPNTAILNRVGIITSASNSIITYQTSRTVKNIINNFIGDKDWKEVNDNKDRSLTHHMLHYSIHWYLAATEIHRNRASVKLFILRQCILSGASGFITVI